MPKNGQVSEKYALLLHITTQGDASCSHLNIVLAQVVDQWSALFLAQLNKNRP
jgi:hypothetical protein